MLIYSTHKYCKKRVKDGNVKDGNVKDGNNVVATATSSSRFNKPQYIYVLVLIYGQ